jgi:hypothetical protein
MIFFISFAIFHLRKSMFSYFKIERFYLYLSRKKMSTENSKRKHPQIRDNHKIVARGPVTACSPSVLAAPIPPGEPLQLQALRGARRATPQLVIGYHAV